jgi:hypothetical protein
MAAGEEGNEQVLDHILLADDYFGQLALNARAAGNDLFDELFVSRLGFIWCLHVIWGVRP